MRRFLLSKQHGGQRDDSSQYEDKKGHFAEPPLAEDSREWLELGDRFGASHNARIVEEGVNRLERSLLEEAYRGVGSEAYRPELMLNMVMFEMLEGRGSPAPW